MFSRSQLFAWVNKDMPTRKRVVFYASKKMVVLHIRNSETKSLHLKNVCLNMRRFFSQEIFESFGDVCMNLNLFGRMLYNVKTAVLSIGA